MTIIQERSNIWQEICAEKRLFKPYVKTFIELAFSHGGFIAGGFARQVMTPMFDPREEAEDLGTVIHDYLGMGRNIERKNRWWKVGKSDIDIFFRTAKGRDSFFAAILKDASLASIPIFDSKTLACKEFDCGDVSIQVIVMCAGAVEDVLSSFDIENAMIAFDATHRYISSNWLELENTKTFHVANWSTCSYSASRTFKWLQKRDYSQLSKETAKEFPWRAIKEVEEIKKKSDLSDYELGSLNWRLSHKLKVMMPMLSSSDIVLLLGLMTFDNYNQNVGLKTLFERSGNDLNHQSFANGSIEA